MTKESTSLCPTPVCCDPQPPDLLLFLYFLPPLPIFYPGEERAAVPLKGEVTKESIEELLKAEKLPTVIEFTDKNSQKIFSAGIERQVGDPARWWCVDTDARACDCVC
jgi:hypothetical protein